MKNTTQTVTLENYLPDESLIWSRLMKVSSTTNSAIRFISEFSLIDIFL